MSPMNLARIAWAVIAGLLAVLAAVWLTVDVGRLEEDQEAVGDALVDLGLMAVSTVVCVWMVRTALRRRGA